METKTFLGIPSYDGTSHFRGQVTPSVNRPVLFSSFENSLAPKSFTALWLAAEEHAVANGITHFAMQHTDILPQPHWLDVLHDEMERLDCDIVSVVTPIKTVEGRTSTAYEHVVDGKLMGRNLTMHEVYQLPETFSAADLPTPGCRLLVNTGLWLCRLGAPWCRHVHFQHATWIDRRGAEPVYAQESEDWLMSRIAHQHGAKVYCTRKVRAKHRGWYEFDNGGPWGTAATTELSPMRSLVPGIDPDFHPPGVIV